MRLFIRIITVCLLFGTPTQILFARSVSAEPLKSPVFKMNEIRSLNDFITKQKNSKAEGGHSSETSNGPSTTIRVCSCQIVDLVSSNYDHRHVALLAEKTNYGNNSDFIITRNRIEKEKKHLKKMFYDKIKLISEVHQTVPCMSLYFELKTEDSQLQLYEILNADSN
jgi:hypothetical protein